MEQVFFAISARKGEKKNKKKDKKKEGKKRKIRTYLDFNVYGVCGGVWFFFFGDHQRVARRHRCCRRRRHRCCRRRRPRLLPRLPPRLPPRLLPRLPPRLPPRPRLPRPRRSTQVGSLDLARHHPSC